MTRQDIILPSVSSLLVCLATIVVGCDHEIDESPAQDEEAIDPKAPSYAGPEPTPVMAGDCCTTDSSPGCSDSGVQACVCAGDPYCCTTAWDGICVNEVELFGCGVCDNPAYCCA
ncbi:MAG TPA: hypothetical protein VK034_26945, partial [Enhygromyxa sp.]|nr:hypothetical protein [Enhygromyxa sp.]